MKRILTHSHIRMYLLLAVICAFLALAASVFAQDTTTTNDRGAEIEARQAEMEAKQAERQAEAEAKQLERETAMEARKVEMEEKKAEREAAMEVHRAELEVKKEERATAIEEKKAEIEARREEKRAVLTERIQTRITGLAENATARLQAAIASMGEIVSRIKSRAEVLEARGVDVSDALRILDSAEAKLAEASAELSGIDVDVEYVVTSDEPRTDWENARAQFSAIRDLLKEARELLREAVSALKEAVQAADTSSSTEETTTE